MDLSHTLIFTLQESPLKLMWEQYLQVMNWEDLWCEAKLWQEREIPVNQSTKLHGDSYMGDENQNLL